MGAVLLAFLLSGGWSVQGRTYLPYLLVPLIIVLASIVVCRYAKPRLVQKMPRWLLALHYGVFFLFVVVLLRFMAQ